MPAAILFDLDDTLTDRTASIAAYARVFERDFRDRLADVTPGGIARALRAADEGGYSRGRRSSRLIERLRWRRSVEVPVLDAHWEARFPACSVPRAGIPGLVPTLRDLDLVLGVVTNGSEAAQRRKLSKLGLEHAFDAVVISESVRLEKPSTAIFALALAELRVSPNEAWFVGDHPLNDVLGSEAAGLTPVWLRGMHRWPSARALPERVIDRLPELPDRILDAREAPPVESEAWPTS